MTSCKKDPAQVAQKELQVKTDDGFCDTCNFPNATWTFGKKQLENGDIELDKTLNFKGAFPSRDDHYDLCLLIDFYDDICIATLPIDITTTSPDGNSKQSRSLEITFNDKDNVKVIGQEGGKTLKRYTQIIYPQRQFKDEGEFTFTVYSKYPKISLPGIKMMAVKATRNNPE